jgi:hypothetical protein
MLAIAKQFLMPAKSSSAPAPDLWQPVAWPKFRQLLFLNINKKGSSRAAHFFIKIKLENKNSKNLASDSV